MSIAHLLTETVQRENAINLMEVSKALGPHEWTIKVRRNGDNLDIDGLCDGEITNVTLLLTALVAATGATAQQLRIIAKSSGTEAACEEQVLHKVDMGFSKMFQGWKSLYDGTMRTLRGD